MDIIKHRTKQSMLHEEVRIIFNSNIASTHWTHTREMLSEFVLVYFTKFKYELCQFVYTNDIKYSAQRNLCPVLQK